MGQLIRARSAEADCLRGETGRFRLFRWSGNGCLSIPSKASRPSVKRLTVPLGTPVELTITS